MDLVVMLAGAVDELASLQDRYERELTNVLESVVAELEKLNPDDRRVFATHVEAMSARAEADPLVSAHVRPVKEPKPHRAEPARRHAESPA